MKTELKLSLHCVLPDQNVIEVWYSGRMIAQITGADGPGVRILSKYSLDGEVTRPERVTPVTLMEVVIGGKV